MSRFEHRFDRDNCRITYAKFGPTDALEYTIEYTCAGDFDAGDWVGAVKKTAGTLAVLQVDKRLDPAGRTIEMKVRQLDTQNAYPFRYRYDDLGFLIEVARVCGDGRVETTRRYVVDGDGLRTEARETNADGPLTAVTSYEYDRVAPVAPTR